MNSDLIEHLRIKVKKLQDFYNQNCFNYSENGEEDFNSFLDLLKEELGKWTAIKDKINRNL